MANVVVTVLSMTIGIFFILIGVIKLSPAVNDELYREMKKQFMNYVKVFPFKNITGWKPKAQMLRKVVGINEVACGTILAFIPGPLKQAANLLLLVQMLGALYFHWASGDPLERLTPALTFTMLLICRYVVHLQVRSREEGEMRAKLKAQADAQEQSGDEEEEDDEEEYDEEEYDESEQDGTSEKEEIGETLEAGDKKSN